MNYATTKDVHAYDWRAVKMKKAVKSVEKALADNGYEFNFQIASTGTVYFKVEKGDGFSIRVSNHACAAGLGWSGKSDNYTRPDFDITSNDYDVDDLLAALDECEETSDRELYEQAALNSDACIAAHARKKVLVEGWTVLWE